ncbi:nucleolin-like [Papaver somniferum]|uniref:nucleolin-like n=1 Tax=Papaver somniferum TaxID=3469 RepID=UPI000E6F8D6C|nr:nucleolin-like [Papaver somniferum]
MSDNTWSKLPDITAQLARLHYERPIQTLRNGEILFEGGPEKGNGFGLISYDPKLDERTRVLRIHGFPYSRDLETYIETIVSVNSGTYVAQQGKEETDDEETDDDDYGREEFIIDLVLGFLLLLKLIAEDESEKKSKSKKKTVSDEQEEIDSVETLKEMQIKAKGDALKKSKKGSDPEATPSRKSQRLKDQVSPQVPPSSPRPEKATKGKKKAKKAAPKEVSGDDTDNEDDNTNDSEDVRQVVDHQKKRKRHEPKQSKDLERMKKKQIERSQSTGNKGVDR